MRRTRGRRLHTVRALGTVDVAEADARCLAAITLLAIVVSLVVHGVTAPLAHHRATS